MWNAPLALSVGGRDGDSFVIPASSFANALEQVPELRLFCLEIFFVVRIGFGPDRHLLDHFQTIALKPDNFLRVICEESEPSHAQIEKNLCAEPIIAQVSCVPEFRVGLYGIESFLLQLVGVDCSCQSDLLRARDGAAHRPWSDTNANRNRRSRSAISRFAPAPQAFRSCAGGRSSSGSCKCAARVCCGTPSAPEGAPWCRRRAKSRTARPPPAGLPFLPDRQRPRCDRRAAARRRLLRVVEICDLVGSNLP